VRFSFDLGEGRFSDLLQPSDGILIAPGAGSQILAEGAHSVRIISVPYCNVLNLLADGPQDLPADGRFSALHAGVLRKGKLASLLEALFHEAQSGSAHGSMFVDGILLQLMGTLLRMQNGQEGPEPGLAKGCLAAWQVRRATDYLMAHLDEDMSLTELAASVRLSPFHFARAFKRSTGRPPQRYLMQLRVERAREILAGTDIALAEIALACGFAGQSHFTTAFKRHTGVTPGAWRAAVRH
jgi:AraC family transcriptional regulator